LDSNYFTTENEKISVTSYELLCSLVAQDFMISWVYVHYALEKRYGTLTCGPTALLKDCGLLARDFM
jgi:hypothetical protein